MRPQRIEVHVDRLVLQGFNQVDAVRLGESVTERLTESLRSDPDGLRVEDVQVVEAERRLASGDLRGPALARLIAAGLEGALRE